MRYEGKYLGLAGAAHRIFGGNKASYKYTAMVMTIQAYAAQKADAKFEAFKYELGSLKARD